DHDRPERTENLCRNRRRRRYGDIVARVSGTMEKAPFKEGSRVRKGDLLFEIEDTIYAANVRSAKSVLAQMEAEYAFAQKEYERYQKLIETQATAQTTYDSSLRTLKSYEAKIEEVKADSDPRGK
ncbi:MAG: biotin/lipoyl-binding protein, partial [Victivallis sp.]